jgi:hypothetical protein
MTIFCYRLPDKFVAIHEQCHSEWLSQPVLPLENLSTKRNYPLTLHPFTQFSTIISRMLAHLNFVIDRDWLNWIHWIWVPYN